jgi:hypothetical protein
MTSEQAPTPDPSTADHERTGQHGPEMDDTQVEATEELRDELPPAAPEGTTHEE